MNTSTKHTPGPWALEHDGDVNDADFATAEYEWPFRIVGPSGQVVVDFCGGSDVTEEDARLMAAAPELRDALAWHIGCLALQGGAVPSDLMEWASSTVEGRGDDRSVLEVTRAAIAKLEAGK